MPIKNSKVKAIYNALRSGNDFTGSEDEFLQHFEAPGQEGYKNRLGIYQTLKSGGADIGASYEEFSKRLGMHAVTPTPSTSKPAMTTAQAWDTLRRGGDNTTAQLANDSIQKAQTSVAESTRVMAENGHTKLADSASRSTGELKKAQEAALRAHAAEDAAKAYWKRLGKEERDKMLADAESRLLELRKKAQAEADKGREAAIKERSELYSQGYAVPSGAAGLSSFFHDEKRSAALVAIDKQLEEIAAAREGRGFWRGILDFAKNPRNWTFGVSQLAGGMATYEAAKKAQEGKPLTAQEKLLLQSVAETQQNEGFVGSQIDDWYRYGQGTGESLQMAGEMALTGGATGAIKGAVKKGIQKLGTNMVTKALGSVAGSALAGAAQSAMLGSADVGADAFRRMTGSVTPKADGSFDITEQEGAVKATAKAFGAHAIENATEYLGGEMVFKAVGKGLSKGGGLLKKGIEKIPFGKTLTGKTSILLENLAKTDIAKATKAGLDASSDLLKKAQVHSIPAEMMEEEIGHIANALLVGDQSIFNEYDEEGNVKKAGLFNMDTQRDIALGTLFTMGVMHAPIAGLGAKNYLQSLNKLRVANRKASVLFDEEWDGISEKLENANNDEIVGVVNGLMNNGHYTNDQAEALTNYVARMMNHRGYTLGEALRADAEKNAGAEEAYVSGYNLDSPDLKQRARYAYEMHKDFAAEVLGMDDEQMEVAFSSENAESTMQGLIDSEQYTEAQLAKVQSYVQARQHYEGMLQRVRDEIEEEVVSNDTALNSRAHTDGMIRPAKLNNGQQVYIVDGDIRLFDDGSTIDSANSSSSILVRDAKTGKPDMIFPDAISSLGEVVDASFQKELSAQEISERIADAATKEIEGAITVEAGAVYPMLDLDGNDTSFQVIPNAEGVIDNGDGTINVSFDGLEGVYAIGLEDLQSQVDEYRKSQILEDINPEVSEVEAVQETELTPSVESTEQSSTPEEKVSALSRVPVDETTGEPVFERADRETALDALNELMGGNADNTAAVVNAQVNQATSELENLRKKAPKKQTPKLSGSPMAMIQAQQQAEADHQAALAAYQSELSALEEKQKAWNGIAMLMRERERAVRDAQQAEFQEKEGKLREEAVARLEEDKRLAAEKQVEQAAIGAHAVNPRIKEKWDAAPKIEGKEHAITLEDGSYWNVNTAGVFNRSYGSKNKEVYSRHTTTKGSVETSETSQAVAQSDTQSVSSMNVSTSSAGKVTKTSENSKGLGDKMSEGGIVYKNETLFPNSSELHLAEHQDDVPDLLPTQGNNVSSTGKVTKTSENSKNKVEKNPTLTDANRASTTPISDLSETNKSETSKPANRSMDVESNLDGKLDDTATQQDSDVSYGKGSEVSENSKGLGDKIALAEENKQEESHRFDHQGNPVDSDGRLVTEKVNSIEELRDEDFTHPSRNVELPALPTDVDSAIGGRGKSVIIKKNIFEKNAKSHKDLEPNESRQILLDALYSPSLYGQNQKATRPYNWILIYRGDKNSGVLIEVNHGKENIEVINWHYLRDKSLKQKEEQAIAEGGLILTLESAAGNTRNSLSSTGKGSEVSENSKGLGDKIALAEKEAEISPTEAQKETGNYKKGHVRVDGMNISIEQPKGSIRSGKDNSGKAWSTEMQHTYGYIRGTESVDGDHIDIFLSDNPESGNVFVVDQVDDDGSFDEHKVMYGFGSIEEAKAAYLSNYSEGWQGLGNITEVSKEDFKKWIDSSKRKTKPFAEYKFVKNVAYSDSDYSIPVDSDGRLVTEKVNSIEELRDEDFTHPSRNVELPPLSAIVSEVIGSDGKPVVIKRSIFARNQERHPDVTPEDSRAILKAALYTPSLYGQNQKNKRPANWVLINVPNSEGVNRLVLLEVSDNKNNVEIVHWHFVDDRGLEKIKRQAAREDGQLLILPSIETEEVGALSDPTDDLSSTGKGSKTFDRKKDKVEKSGASVSSSEKIEDAGSANIDGASTVRPVESANDEKLMVTTLGGETEVNVVDLGNEVVSRDAAKELIAALPKTIAEENTPVGVGEVRIGRKSRLKLEHTMRKLSPDRQSAFIAMLPHFEDIMANSLLIEEHRDRIKSEDGIRYPENKGNSNIDKVQRLYGAVTYDGVTYRVKTTVRVYSQNEQGIRLPNYDVTEVELLIPKTETPKSGSTQSRTNNSITLANLLQDVEFSYESGKKISDELVKNSNYYSERVAQGDGERSSMDGGSRGVADVATSLALDLLSKADASNKIPGDVFTDSNATMTSRVEELAEKLNTPVRIIRSAEELAQLPTERQRRMKGSFNPMARRGEAAVTIVLPNHSHVGDIENTFIHEAIGHDGLRLLFDTEEKLNNALDELYRISEGGIQKTIDQMAERMYQNEVERLREQKRKEREARGEDANAAYYADMAAAHAEANKKRAQFRRTATEEYGADLAGRIGEKGFENMTAEELTFWGKLKAMLEKALQRLLRGLGIPNFKKWGDKEWAFVYHEAYKRKKNGGHPTIFDAAETYALREKTGFGETMYSDGNKKSAQLNEAALKHLEPIDVEHVAKVEQKRGIAKEELAKVAEIYKNTTDSKGFISDLINSLGLMRGNTGSGYGSFETPNGKVFTIRISNHNINTSHVGSSPVESIVIKTKRSPNRFQAEDGKYTNEYVYFKEDIRKAPAGTLSNIAEGIAAMLETGEYHDKTGLAKENHSPIQDVSQGKALYLDKEKIQTLIDQQRTNLADVDYLDLDSVANIVESFENPNLSDENFGETMYSDGKHEQKSQVATTIADMKQRVTELFEKAKTGEFVGKPASIGRLSVDGKAYLEKLSDLKFKEFVDFVLNPSDLNHIRSDHYGENEKDKGNNVPLTDEDIQNMVDVLNQPDGILYGVDKKDGRKLFFFLKDAGNGLYNLTEVCSTKKGNLTAKSFFKSKKKGISQRVMEIKDSLLPTSVTYSGEFLSSDAKIPTLFEINEGSSKNVADDGLLLRDGDYVEASRKAEARETYERRMRSGWYQAREALQDSMLSLKVGMQEILKSEGVEMNIEEIPDYENAYTGENHLSSVNYAEIEAMERLLFEPLMKEVYELGGDRQSGRQEIIDYMMAKHGLERNQVMAEREGKQAYEAYMKKNPNSAKTVDEFIAKARERDYSGLTTLFATDGVVEAEQLATEFVQEFEDSHDTNGLWEAVNKANRATLSKYYESGMMGKEEYESILAMYEHYIPLRGFDETTSDEVYSYLSKNTGVMTTPIKHAKGRTSKADDPFAQMKAMAETAVIQGNRNTMVKQRALTFALNHPSDLLSVSELWVMYDDVNDEWRAVTPEGLEVGDSPAEVEAKLAAFEEKMTALAESDPDHYKKGKEAINIPYRVVGNGNQKEHQVIVKRGGKAFVLTVNGSPRLAQALNGQTNPDNDQSGAIGSILKAGESLNLQLSAMYTTRNPDFIVSNFMRDMLYSNTMVWVKETPNYALRFHKNVGRCNPATMKMLFTKFRNGTLDMGDQIERSFHLFMMNGGETGYTSLRDIETQKKDLLRMLEKSGDKLTGGKVVDFLTTHFDEVNRSVENTARFAAFLTSRELGRSIGRSVHDAKEISVNFNKKGSGAKFLGAQGQTLLGNAAAFTGGLGRSLFIFWNASIQGMTNFGRATKRHPAKALTGASAMFLLGALMPYLGHLGDDDDDDVNAYKNLPEHVRRTHLMTRLGDTWLSLPLPVEYRAIYGMGELMSSIMINPDAYTAGDIAMGIASQMSQTLPLDVMEGSGGWSAFTPSSVKPIVESYGTERSWTGMPLYKDTPYNTNMPEWTKAYSSANQQLVGLSRILNEASGGDDFKKGLIDFNPAKIENMLKGYFGGLYSTGDKLIKMGETLLGEREYNVGNMLGANRLFKQGDDQTEHRALNEEFYRWLREAEETQDLLKNYTKASEGEREDAAKYAEKLQFLNYSKEYGRYQIYEEYREKESDRKKWMKYFDTPADDAESKKEEMDLKRSFVQKIRAFNKGEDPSVVDWP